MRPLPALPHLANCGRAGGHQKKGKKEEKHWNAPQCQGGPAVPAAHGWARRAGAIQKKAVTMGEYQRKEWKTWSSISIYSGREFQ